MVKFMKPASSIQVIDRAASLLDAIARAGGEASLKVLAADSGLHPSTAFRILGSLIANSYVERSPTGNYRLGIRLLQLAAKVGTHLDVRREAPPIMEWLRNEIGETVNLTLRDRDEVVYVERFTPSRMMRVEQVVGSRAPLHVTAVGKLLLGVEGEAGVRAYAERTRLPSYTRNTLAEVESLVREVREATARGWALDDEEAEMGVGCIGVLIRDNNGHAVAGLSISAPIDRRREEWIPLVVEAGRRISARLGHAPEGG
ncbi:IclR family transcriptional regulator [Thioalbus denitrificans]|uniref:HTH-type transcriptional repressor AllR n=2 Tax=Thioalbus denitrificans TaxID=547122 RepID=A0A369CFD0_9GAMM|nr:IclR family transcriptional regulator [Thioalbus denitrificans]